MPDMELIPLAEAARRMGVSDKTIRRWIKRGRLAGFRRGDATRGQLFVSPDDLDAQIQPVETDDSRSPQPSRPRDNRPPKDKPAPPPPAPKRSTPKKQVAA